MRKHIAKTRCHNLCLAIFLLLSPPALRAERISLPLQIDFPLLRQFLVSQLFDPKTLEAELLNDATGCSEIILANPQLIGADGLLQFDSHLRARLAVKMLDDCVPLLNWDGYARIRSRPVIKADNPRQIYLQFVDSQLLDMDNRPLVSGELWQVAAQQLQPWFNRYQLDLKPTMTELEAFVPKLFPRDRHKQVKTLLASMHLANLQVSETGINVQLHLEVDDKTRKPSPEQPLTAQEQQQWQTRWQHMDSLLTFAIKHYAASTDMAVLRQALFDLLLDTRYEFQDVLRNNLEHDRIRDWFIRSWSRLIPIVRQISISHPDQAPLALLTLTTASDLLQALDKLGPTLGLDISDEGLRRLARMVNNSPGADPLFYNKSLDPELLHLFRFNPPPQQHSESGINPWPVDTAIAAAGRPLDVWIPRNHELKAYLSRVRTLLKNSARQTTDRTPLNAAQKKVFERLILTTAWQESCWRQFVVEKNKIVPIRSSTGDTGIMQINENVWRGFVDRHKLRWDIAYNVESGSQILLNYLTRYAIKQGEHRQPGGIDNLARAAYSAYNGGPGQINRYRNSKTAKAWREIDRAFQDKYVQVKQGRELAVTDCLGGPNLIQQAASSPDTASKQAPNPEPSRYTGTVSQKSGPQSVPAPGRATRQIVHDDDWIRRQNPHHFTLQLGGFGSVKAARTFISRQKPSGHYAIYRQRQPSGVLHTVIYGHYSNRSNAARESALFKTGKPWIRSFQSIQSVMK